VKRSVRGAATTELALLMIVLVPVFLYTLFLHDLLRHQLMGQAAVVSTPWDWHALNYERFNRNANVDTVRFDKARVSALQSQPVGGRTGNAPAVYARLMWCDHTAAYNSYDPNYDCNDSTHHRAVSAHACWDTQLAQEVGCGMDAETGAGYVDPFGMIGSFRDEVHRGGEVYCSARVGVLNYFLPQKLFSSFSDVDTTRAKQLSGDVHGHRGESAANTYPLVMERFSVLHDPWSQTTVTNVNPPGTGVLQRRVNSIYWTPMGMAAYGAAMLYVGMGVRDQLISPLALLPADTPFTDNLMSANVSYQTAPGGRVDNAFYPSPWRDWEANPVEATHRARGRFYMGMTAEPR
jgi:hypothetical protein